MYLALNIESVGSDLFTTADCNPYNREGSERTLRVTYSALLHSFNQFHEACDYKLQTDRCHDANALGSMRGALTLKIEQMLASAPLTTPTKL